VGARLSDGGTDPKGESNATSPVSTAILLCGGRGSRLGGDVEKPLVEVGGKPVVDRVLAALEASRIERVVAVSSPHTPETTRHLRNRQNGRGEPDGGDDERGPPALVLEVCVGSGEGYVADLTRGLSMVTRPAVTVAADLPLLRGSDVDDVIHAARSAAAPDTDSRPSVTVCVPVATKHALGVSVETTVDHEGTQVAPTGLNVVAGETDRVIVRDRDSLAVNVNHPSDLGVARRLVRERR